MTARTAWFEEARLGLFIHWNVCAALEGRYAGEPVRQTEYGEWLRARNRVPREDWDRAAAKMHITPEIVEGWAEAAKQAGMRYVVFVTKHHDGLAYWPSEVSDYTLNNLAGIGFDILAALKAACDKRGLKLGFYYSHWQDWEDRGGWGNFWEFNSDDPKQFEGRDDLFFYSGEGFSDTLTPEAFDRYWREKSMAQVEELIRRYQPALFWFDCWLPREQTNMTETQILDLLALIRRLDPSIIVNSRLAISKIGGDDGADYETMGDNEFPETSVEHPWESAVTFSLSWGYSRDDQNWRPTTYFIRNLVRNISMGGNLVINVGPMADGRIPEEALVRMREIGRCLALNGAGFYGCRRSEFAFDDKLQDWGLTTLGAEDELFLHVYDWPVDGIVRVNGLRWRVESATLCATGEDLKFSHPNLIVHIEAPKSMPVAYDTVIRLKLRGDGYPSMMDALPVGERNGGGIHLGATDLTLVGCAFETPKFGTSKLTDSVGSWREGAMAFYHAYVPFRGRYRCVICYACAAEAAGQEYFVEVAGTSFRGITVATMRNWTDYRPFHCGEVELPAGSSEVKVLAPNPVRGELFKLLWIYLEPVDR